MKAYMTGATSVAAGARHSGVVLGSGDRYTYTWGDDWRGQLGLGMNYTNKEDAIYPFARRVVGASSSGDGYLLGTRIIRMGAYHTVAVGNFDSMTDGVYAWGWGEYGQLGAGTVGTNSNMETVSIIPLVMRYGQQGGLMSNVKDVACGDYHTVLLMDRGIVRVAGGNTKGQIANVNGSSSSMGSDIGLNSMVTNVLDVADKTGQRIEDAVAIAAGGEHTMILRGSQNPSDGSLQATTLYTYGSNAKGQLGVETVPDSEAFQRMDMDSMTMVIDNTMTMVEQLPTLDLPEGAYLVELGAGFESSAAVDNLGNVYTWGGNDTGALGEMSTVNRNDISPAGFFESWMVDVNGEVNGSTASKLDSRIQLRTNDTIQVTGTIERYISNYSLREQSQLPVNGDVNDLTFTSTDERIASWNSTGMLTAGKLPGTVLVGIHNEKTGHSALIAVTVENWIPVETTTLTGDRQGVTPKVSVGEGFSVALMSNGEVYTWGDNTYGQLGSANITVGSFANSPVKVNGLDPDEINGRWVADIAAGKDHAVAVFNTGEVYAWAETSMASWARERRRLWQRRTPWLQRSSPSRCKCRRPTSWTAGSSRWRPVTAIR